MTKDNFDDFICWNKVIDGDVLRKHVERVMKTLQEVESLTKENTKTQAEEKIKKWLSESANRK